MRLAQVLVEPAQQRRQVHRRRRADPALTRAREEGEAVIRVRDNGIGIPPEMLPRIFDMFTQADRSLERAQGGLGIGLTLVKRLVEMHGGTVEAAATGRARGASSSCRLPIPLAARRGAEPDAGRRGDRAAAPLAASWSSTTTRTPPRPWRCCSG